MGKWDEYFLNRNYPFSLGSELTYKIGMSFLEDCDIVEDWGCANGYAKQFCKSPTYIGLDGSKNICSNNLVDLRYYSSNVNGIFIRHVLEHNAEWQLILENVLKSFTKKASLIFGGPWKEITHIKDIIADREIVNMGFRKNDIIDMLQSVNFVDFSIEGEHVFLMQK